MEYEVWWPLHARAAKGEILTAEEDELLKSAYAEQDREEGELLSPGFLRQAETLEKLNEEMISLLKRIEVSRKDSRRVQSQIRRLSKVIEPQQNDAVKLVHVS